MYINLDPEEIKLIAGALSLLKIEAATNLKDKLDAKLDESQNQFWQDLFAKYRDAAKDTLSEDGKIEVDDNALVSIGEDPGAYVMVWHWVSNAAADIEDSDDDGLDTE